MGIIQAWTNLGDERTPRDVYRRRKQVIDAMRRVGSPVLIKRTYSISDVEKGDAQRGPNYVKWAGQARHNDPISHGVGFVSVETSDNEWISPDGQLVIADSLPGNDFIPAPKYRGYGPGFLTFVIQPDAPVDTFKLTPTGVLVKTQDATGQAPWYPALHDNDIMINVTIDGVGNILSTEERYQLKMVTPITVRGLQRKGYKEQGIGIDEIGGNRYLLNQTFQMSLLPPNDSAYKVETDR